MLEVERGEFSEANHAGRERGVEGEAVLAVAFDVGGDLRAGVPHCVDHAPRIGMAGEGFLPRLVHRRRKGGAAHGQDGDFVAVPGLLHHPRHAAGLEQLGGRAGELDHPWHERAHRTPHSPAHGGTEPPLRIQCTGPGDAHARDGGVAQGVALRSGWGGGTRLRRLAVRGLAIDALRTGGGLRVGFSAAKSEQAEPGSPGDSGPDGDGFFGRHKGKVER